MRSISQMCFALSLALSAAPLIAQEADDTPQNQGSSQAGSTNGGTGGQHHHLLAQLHLSEAQKAQIKQIKQSTTDKAQRRQQIRAILTPEQKQLLRRLIRERKEQGQASSQ